MKDEKYGVIDIESYREAKKALDALANRAVKKKENEYK